MNPFRIGRFGLAMALAATASACASTGGGESTVERDDDVITAQELEEASSLDLYGVINRLHPRWLRARQERTFASETTVSVLVDGVRRGGPGALRSIRTVTVREVRYMSARDATTMYGPDMAGGAILVYTRR